MDGEGHPISNSIGATVHKISGNDTNKAKGSTISKRIDITCKKNGANPLLECRFAMVVCRKRRE